MSQDETAPRTVKLKEPCGECDGEGRKTTCEGEYDPIYGTCSVSVDVPCDNCGGRGWIKATMPKPDPYWRAMYRYMALEEGRPS